MFNQSRKKIILSIMGSLILLFVITLSVIVLASFREIRHKNLEMLERYVEMYSLDKKSDSVIEQQQALGQKADLREPPINERAHYQLSTFYSVAISDDGSVLAVDNGGRETYNEEELIQIAKKILAGNKQSGRLDNLTYIAGEREGYTLVAFMDNTVSEAGLKTLMHYVLIVVSSSIIAMFFVSLILSNNIIRPLEENDRQQKQFISDASHELKTPVAVIATNAEMLLHELGDNEWLTNIQYENDRMGELVKQLLDLSCAENAIVSMEQLDLSRIVTGEALAFESLAFDKGKNLLTDLEEGIILTGNQSQLTQLVSILLDNAIRHSTGSEIQISLMHRNHMAVLSVVNDGDDIPQEKLKHLFDRFYRVDEARNSEGQHYGIGLSIAKAVAEKHSGSIGASFRNGKISFTVTLPIKK